MRLVFILFLLTVSLLASCTAKKKEFFNFDYLQTKLIDNHNIDISKALVKAHNLSNEQIDSIETAIMIHSDYSYVKSLFYEDINSQITGTDIKLEQTLIYISESFNKSTLKSLYDKGELKDKDYEETIEYIDIIRDGLIESPFFNARLFQENLEYMHSIGALTEREYSELILTNFLAFNIDFLFG